MKKLIGGILLGLGILIGGASGLCTAVALISLGPAALLFGAVPIAIGVGLFFAGRNLVRTSAPEEIQGDDDTP